MGQEFFIKSDTLEDKVRQILPSQGGLGQNFDLSASTQIVPIVDLTESAEGSTLRADLQNALSFANITAFQVSNTTSTLVNNTGFYRVYGYMSAIRSTSTLVSGNFSLTDGASTKIIASFFFSDSAEDRNNIITPFDFTVFMEAGDSLTATSSSANITLSGSTRQLATITGELVNP